jgi:putative methyltransferase (TIGR04325 family)
MVRSMSLKSFIPPAILEIRRRMRPGMPTFNSYDEAAARCGAGYGEDELVRVVVEKTRLYRDSLLVNPTVGGRVNCIDFGGAAGAHFFLARSLFGRSFELNWNVVETQGMVAAAGAVRSDGLRFFTDIAAAASSIRAEGREIDLVFTSCALPYVRDPEGMLRELTGVGARRIFVTRNPLAERKLERRVAIQTSRLSANGPGPLPDGFKDRALSYPVTFCDKAAFEGILAERYALDLTFEEERDAYYLQGAPVAMYGYLGVRLPAQDGRSAGRVRPLIP